MAIVHDDRGEPANTVPGRITVDTTWNGTTNTRIATGAPIAAATAAAPAVHTYTITAVVHHHGRRVAA